MCLLFNTSFLDIEHMRSYLSKLLLRLEHEVKHSALNASEGLTVNHFEKGSQLVTNVVNRPVGMNALTNPMSQRLITAHKMLARTS